MVADAVYAVPHPVNLASEALTMGSDACPVQEHLPRNTSRQDGAWGWMRDEGKREPRDGGEAEEGIILSVKEESDPEEQSLSQAVDDADDQDDPDDGRLIMVDEAELEDGQDTEENSSSKHFAEASQVKKGCGNPAWHKKSQQKMNHAKQWILNNLFLATSVSVVSLNEIEEAYTSDCHREGQDPLIRYVLARLIHQQFPEAGKCRRGSRGNQKINYTRLQWRVSRQASQRHLNGVTSPASKGDSTQETPSDDMLTTETKPLNLMPDTSKKPPSGINPRDSVQDLGPEKHDSELSGDKEYIGVAAHHPAPEDEDGEGKECEAAANRFLQVVKSIKLQGKFSELLKTFAHSASCDNLQCNPLCLMFRRVRRHVVSALHPCYVMRIYSLLLKLHVSSCKNNSCGMTACPALRASRQLKRGRDDEFQQMSAQQEQQQLELQHVTKKPNVQVRRPSSLMIRPPSPALSLPDSLPGTPSPVSSPSHTLPPSPVRIVPLHPHEMRHMAKIPSGHQGA